ncbi:MAG: ligase-associated DNA damage response exonuclease [Bacteroidetes bacterium]|nr:ligase-associated DNA damage response exonuclease [Bacteroidota bacterium]
MKDLLVLNENGLYCELGDFYIDPVKKVDKAIITHAHGDHARKGMGWYLSSQEGLLALQHRMGSSSNIQSINYGQKINIKGITVSLHPAGHILGSSQIRLEYKGHICVFSGDYKLYEDQTCSPFEYIKSHNFISECTFGLPKYIWPETRDTFNEINNWWKNNSSQGICSVFFAYSLGKAQHILSGLNTEIGPIYSHRIIAEMNDIYIKSGVKLPHSKIPDKDLKENYSNTIIVVPPFIQNAPWLKQFGTIQTGFSSGWFADAENPKRTNIDKGFILSDHADWPSINLAITNSGCEKIIFNHGFVSEITKHYQDLGYNAVSLED